MNSTTPYERTDCITVCVVLSPCRTPTATRDVRGSPESVADSAAADQQATEIEQLKKQLEAANLQIRDKDNRLAAADADHHHLQEQLQHMQQERDTVRFLQERAQIRQQRGPPPTSAFSPVPDQRPVDTDQTAVLEVVDQWNRRQQPPARSPAVNQHHQHHSSPTYNWSGLSHSRARATTPLRHHAQSHFTGRDGASSRSSTSSPAWGIQCPSATADDL